MLFSQLLTDLQYILDERQGQCAFHVLVEISPLLFLSPNIARHDICKSICAQTNGHATNNSTWLEFIATLPNLFISSKIENLVSENDLLFSFLGSPKSVERPGQRPPLVLSYSGKSTIGLNPSSFGNKMSAPPANKNNQQLLTAQFDSQ